MTLTQVNSAGIKDDSIVNADIKSDAAIAKSKLAALDLVNADINASAAIAKSKLASLDIVNADVNASAAIAGSKLAAATTSAAGSMSAADKTKLDGVATSATANPSAPALTGSTNNTICTVTGANAIQGEANLTFDGEQLNVTHAGTTDPENQIVLQTSAVDAGGGSGIFLKSSSATTANRYGSRIHTVREANGASQLVFSTELTGGTTGLQEALKISPNKNVTVSDGDLVIGTAGHGIDFSATSDATGKDNELLDDYEEGSWTPVAGRYSGTTTVSYSTQTGKYTKIGNVVYVQFYIVISSISAQGSSLTFIGGLPFGPDGAYSNSGNLIYNQGLQHDDESDSTFFVTAHQEGGGRIYFKKELTADDTLSTKDWQAGAVTGGLWYRV